MRVALGCSYLGSITLKLLSSGKRAKTFDYLGKKMRLALAWLPIETQIWNKQQY